jgi:hypothetical protein
MSGCPVRSDLRHALKADLQLAEKEPRRARTCEASFMSDAAEPIRTGGCQGYVVLQVSGPGVPFRKRGVARSRARKHKPVRRVLPGLGDWRLSEGDP